MQNHSNVNGEGGWGLKKGGNGSSEVLNGHSENNRRI
jgi:hypothetical protein